MHMTSSRNVLSIVVDRELSGNARGLRSLPPRFLAGIDAGGGPRDRGHVGTGELLLQLDSEMPAPAELRKLIADLSARLGESASQREVFLCCGGDAIISRVLLQLCRREAGRPSARLPEGAPLDVINECTQLLAELAMLDLQHAEALASRHELIGTLFLLMAEPQAADAALALSMTVSRHVRDMSRRRWTRRSPSRRSSSPRDRTSSRSPRCPTCRASSAASRPEASRLGRREPSRDLLGTSLERSRRPRSRLARPRSAARKVG